MNRRTLLKAIVVAPFASFLVSKTEIKKERHTSWDANLSGTLTYDTVWIREGDKLVWSGSFDEYWREFVKHGK